MAAWNKGLSAKIDERVKKYSEKRLKRINLVCLNCKKEFQVRAYLKNVRKYCSPKCQIRKSKHRISKICVFCNKSFFNHDVKVFGKAFKKRQFCSYNCWKEARIKRKLEWKSKSHDFLIFEQRKKMELEGFKVITLKKVLPDLIAIKNGKIYAVEVETGSQRANYKKYEKVKDYDDVLWILKPTGIGRYFKKVIET